MGHWETAFGKERTQKTQYGYKQIQEGHVDKLSWPTSTPLFLYFFGNMLGLKLYRHYLDFLDWKYM